MKLYLLLQDKCVEAFKKIFNVKIDVLSVQIEETSPDFKGDFTIIVFPLSRFSKQNPENTAKLLGDYLKKELSDVIQSFGVVKGFLNLVIKTTFWNNYLMELVDNKGYIVNQSSSKKSYLIEFSSPNTNKPLHLGHIRNNLIGQSISDVLRARGHKVIKANLINDRGIHICKSMLAWMEYGKGETPAGTNIKGDHLIGKYYVLFNTKLKDEINELMKKGLSKEEAEKNSPLMIKAQKLLIDWEKGDQNTRKVWKTMNEWAYKGFDETYNRLGISFDKIYYESDTYTLGKDIVLEGLTKKIFYKKDDESVWADLGDSNLDDKLLLRPDGTSVYMTQDIGTAELKYNDFQPDKSIYVVGDEQEHHFKVLKIILKKLGKVYADSLYHLSYGMVDLPEGKMKSREGTVVDADELMIKMSSLSKEYMDTSGKINFKNEDEKSELSEIIGIGALKFHIIKTDVRKRITFNPTESIDFQGHTGPFIQYTHARVKSVLRKSEIKEPYGLEFNVSLDINELESQILKKIYLYNDVLTEVEKELDSSLIANYAYSLAKLYNRFYHEYSILKEENENRKNFRLLLSIIVADTLKNCMSLLGIKMPDKM